MSKHVPVNREEFKELCLRKLGKGVIQINVSDDQVEDAVETSLKKFYDYHYDGTTKVYLKHQITTDDKTNRYVPVTSSNIGIIKVFPIGGGISNSGSMFNLEYQIMLNDLYTLTAQSMVPYYMTMQQLRLLEQLLIGDVHFRFNRHDNRLYLDINWDKLEVGQYIIAECYYKVDPDVNTDVWSDAWLIKYCTTLIQKQWGMNLTKFVGVATAGGVSLNGERILSEAIEHLEKLDAELMNSYSLMPMDIIG